MSNTIFIQENNKLAISLIRSDKHKNLNHVHYYYILPTNSHARLINNSKVEKSQRFPKYTNLIGYQDSADDSREVIPIPNDHSRLRLSSSFKKTNTYMPLITKTTAFNESELKNFLAQRFT